MFGVLSVISLILCLNSYVLSQITEIQVRRGDHVELECDKNKRTEYRIWKVNWTQVIYISSSRRFSSFKNDRISYDETTGSLNIYNFQEQDSGHYECDYPYSSLIGIHYSVKILKWPVISGLPYNQISVKKNETVPFNCVSPSAQTISWLKDNQKISSNAKMVVKYPALKDSGVYKCIASNKLGSVSHQFRLIVLSAPEVEVTTNPVYARIGQSAKIECIVRAEPTPNIYWFSGRENIRISPNDNIKFDRNDSVFSLEILSVSPDHFDNYSCVANNYLGSVESQLIQVSPDLSGCQTSSLSMSVIVMCVLTLAINTLLNNIWKNYYF